MTDKLITSNRKAYHDYEILETWEAGIALLGTEVKAIRDGRINLQDGWVDVTHENEAILRQVHISPYSFGNINNHDPHRPRRLLLKKRELKQLHIDATQKGLTIIPLKVYLKGRYVKVVIGLAKGKKHYDKRETKKEQEAKRIMDRALKNS